MSNTWLYLHEESIDTIRKIAASLSNLAKGFLIVGNRVVSDDLYAMAEDLEKATATARRAWRGRLNELYNESQADVGTIISALLNIDVGSGKKGN